MNTSEKVSFMLEWLKNKGIDDETLLAIKRCFATRGPNKGYLLRKCPDGYGIGVAAWQALVAEANAYKASIGRILLLGEKEREVYWRLSNALKDFPKDIADTLDKDAEWLKGAGVW